MAETKIYPGQVARALDLNMMDIIEATRMKALFSPWTHPEKWEYWDTRLEKLRAKRQMLQYMDAESANGPYEPSENPCVYPAPDEPEDF